DRAGGLRDRPLRPGDQPLPAADGSRAAAGALERTDGLGCVIPSPLAGEGQGGGLKITTAVTFLSSYGHGEWAQRRGRKARPGPHPSERYAVPSSFLFQARTGDRRDRPAATAPDADGDG